MRAMQLEAARAPLRPSDLPLPAPRAGEVRIKIAACGVCRTDLHILDGEVAAPRLPLTPGHEIVGTVAALGPGVRSLALGERVGVPWLGWTCGTCAFCRSGRENLCDSARFTGLHIDGGYAEYTVADARYCFGIPAGFSDVAAAPLLCAGLIGYRTLKLAGEAERVGIYGFGAAAHILAQVIRHQGRRLYAFTRPGDRAAQDFARGLGARWAGGSDELPPEPLDAALLFAPVGSLIPAALAATVKGGTVVSGGIHMSDIPSFPYRLLWEERQVRSVANLTRADGEELLALAARIPIETSTTVFPLAQANDALERLRQGRIEGAAVLVP
ncbi:MAG TPA: zinc-dependent alcohol dehydrogenase family protein [Stellaceae bacterium]|nr:zinc-dependent alcohol dehydrogenase family protein [Stellaceae bacterium]